MKVSLALKNTEALEALYGHALEEVSVKRGGRALLHTLGVENETAFLNTVIDSSSLWYSAEADTPLGFVIMRASLIEVVYVVPARRRQGIARALVQTLLALEQPPLDAYALPGDRAMKSLYESIGWKARLLTMRAG